VEQLLLYMINMSI